MCKKAFRALRGRTWPFVLSLWIPSLAASAQPSTPSPTPSPASTPASAPVWHNPSNTNFSIVDPCGGPKELLNKFGPTPCVYVLGQGMISAGYTNISAHGSLSVSNGAHAASLPISGNANVYPSLLMTVGVSANSQLQFTAPSAVSVNTARFGTFPPRRVPRLPIRSGSFSAQRLSRSSQSPSATQPRPTVAALPARGPPIRSSSIRHSR